MTPEPHVHVRWANRIKSPAAARRSSCASHPASRVEPTRRQRQRKRDRSRERVRVRGRVRQSEQVHGGRCGWCGARGRGYLSPSFLISANTRTHARTHACMHVCARADAQCRSRPMWQVVGRQLNSRHTPGSSAVGPSQRWDRQCTSSNDERRSHPVYLGTVLLATWALSALWCWGHPLLALTSSIWPM